MTDKLDTSRVKHAALLRLIRAEGELPPMAPSTEEMPMADKPDTSAANVDLTIQKLHEAAAQLQAAGFLLDAMDAERRALLAERDAARAEGFKAGAEAMRDAAVARYDNQHDLGDNCRMIVGGLNVSCTDARKIADVLRALPAPPVPDGEKV